MADGVREGGELCLSVGAVEATGERIAVPPLKVSLVCRESSGASLREDVRAACFSTLNLNNLYSLSPSSEPGNFNHHWSI